jgi:acyl CoA:acetate/3-ketoacid CoA transferase beta subunit
MIKVHTSSNTGQVQQAIIPPPSPPAPGSYQVIAVLPENVNYLMVTTEPCTFTIAQIKVPVTLADQNVTYDGAAVDKNDYAKAVYSASGAVAVYQFYSDAACTETCKIDPPTDAGTYYLKATVSAPNYSDGTAIAKFTIEQKLPVVTIKKDGTAATSESTCYGAVISLTYDIESGVTPTVTVSQPDYVTAVLDTAKKTLTLTVQKAAAAQQTVTVTLNAPTDGANYKASSAAYTLTVSQAALTVAASPYSGTYDGTAHNAGSLTVKNSAGNTVSAAVYYSATETLTAANYSTAGSTAVPQVTNVDEGGKTVYYCIVDSNGNYAPQSGSYKVGTISPAPITETIIARTSVYGDAPAALTYSLTAGNVYNSEDLGVTLSCAVTSSSAVGSYAITGAWTNTNYKVTFVNGTGAYTVTARPVKVTIQNQTAVYSGSEPTVDQTKWTLTDGSMANGTDSLDVMLTKTAGVNVGSYDITGMASNKNYSVTYVNGSYAITKKPLNELTVAAVADLTFTGLAQTPGVTVTYGKLTLTQGTDYTLSYSGNINVTDAARINITAADSGNYSGSASATFKIVKAKLTVTAEAKSKTYGGAFPSFTATYKGFVNGETKDVLSGTLIYTVKKGDTAYAADAAYTMPVGSYNIVPSGCTSDNYTITFINGTLTVSAKAINSSTISVTAADTSKVYTGSSLEPAISVGDTLDNSTTPNLARGTDYTIAYAVKSGSTGSLSGGLPVGSGTYTVTLSGKGNYTGSVKTTEFVVTAKTNVTGECTVALDTSAYIYDGSAHKPAVTVTDTARSTVLTVGRDYNISFTADCTNVGNKTVTVTFSGNYSGMLTKEYSITKKDVSALNVSLASYDKIYTGTAKEPGVTVTYNANANPALNTDYIVEYTNNLNAGTASVTITGIGTNYTGSKTVNFTIEKAQLSIAFTDDISASACSKVGSPSVTMQNDLILKNTHTGNTATAAGRTGIGFDGTISYVSSNTNIATVDESGLVTMTSNPGNAKITATVTSGGTNYTYTAPLTNYFLLVTSADINANITANISSYDGDYDGKAHGITIADVAPAVAKVTYSTAYDAEGNGYTETNPTYTAAGTYTVYYRITADGYNPRTGSAAVTIRKTGAGLSFASSSVTAEYGGNASNALIKATDATVTYASSNPAVATADAATGTITILGVGTTIITATTPEAANYESGSAYYALTVTANSIADADVTIPETYTYTGSLVVPSGVTVKLGDKTLAQGTDYTLSFSDNLNAGAAKATVTGVGNYSGTATQTFTIQKASLEVLTLQTTSYAYTGSEVPVIVSNVTAKGGDGVTLSGLRLGTDYTLTYSPGVHTDVGSYTVTAVGTGNYQGNTAAVNFTIAHGHHGRCLLRAAYGFEFRRTVV